MTPSTATFEASHHGGEFRTVGEVFSEDTNPGRKKPFDIRAVMAAAVDRDHPTLERWYGMQDAEIAVVWEAHIGGYPVSLLGIEVQAMAASGLRPADGPDQWTSGTLFPMASKKVARAINAASGNRPLVVLANLSGFDGSPESMRHLQLEYGAEIGRAVVNFEGPIVFCVVSRYHGGAFVVFSEHPQRQHGGGRARRCASLGDRWGAGRRGRVCERGTATDRGRPEGRGGPAARE